MYFLTNNQDLKAQAALTKQRIAINERRQQLLKQRIANIDKQMAIMNELLSKMESVQ